MDPGGGNRPATSKNFTFKNFILLNPDLFNIMQVLGNHILDIKRVFVQQQKLGVIASFKEEKMIL